MTDMTAAQAERRLAASKARIASFRENAEAEQKQKKERRDRLRQARKAARANKNLWCSLGRHRTERHLTLQEDFRGGTVCMQCQFKIVENLESVLELPAVTEAMARMARLRHVEKKQRAKIRAMTRETGATGDGLVYYMRINGRIKIGYTTNLPQRSRNYPPGTELLAVEPGTRETEAKRHMQFSRSLAQGREWFAESEDIKTHMDGLAATYGIPRELMYRHSRHEGIKHV